MVFIFYINCICLLFHFPLYVMLVTSLKTMEEIRQGTLLSWPSGLNLESWAVAWGGRGYGAGDTFLRPYFWNSIKMVVPAVFFSRFIGIPFTTLFFRNYYISVPTELVKAARIDGAGFFKIFFKILLPISAPIIVVTVIWQFTQIWNDFLFGSTFSFGEAAPIQVALNNMVLSSTSVKEYNVDMASAIIAGIPTLIVYVLAGKYFIRGLTSGAVKG